MENIERDAYGTEDESTEVTGSLQDSDVSPKNPERDASDSQMGEEPGTSRGRNSETSEENVNGVNGNGENISVAGCKNDLQLEYGQVETVPCEREGGIKDIAHIPEGNENEKHNVKVGKFSNDTVDDDDDIVDCEEHIDELSEMEDSDSEITEGNEDSIVDSSDLLLSEHDEENHVDIEVNDLSPTGAPEEEEGEEREEEEKCNYNEEGDQGHNNLDSQNESNENEIDAVDDRSNAPPIEDTYEDEERKDNAHEGTELRHLRQKFGETKKQIIKLVREESSNLPTEYDKYTHRAISFLSDFERNETNLSHLGTERLLQYLLTVLLYETNEILQLLHDVAEDRVIRGESLTKDEITFVTDLTQHYNTLLKELLPEVRPNMLNAVVAFDYKGATSKRDMFREKDRKREEKIAMNDLSELELSSEEISQFQEKYIRRAGEELLRCGVLVELTGLKRKLRYLFLTNYQLMVSEAVFILKRAIDLPSISKASMVPNSKVTSTTPTPIHVGEDGENKAKNGSEEDLTPSSDDVDTESHQFDIFIGKVKKSRFYCRQAQQWTDDVNKAIISFMSLGKEFAKANDDDRELDVSEDVSEIEDVKDCEIAVMVREGQNFEHPPKKRPDNPYYIVGVGNPEHYMQDRTARQSSSVCKGIDPHWEEWLHFKLRPSMEFSLDIRFYSKIPGGKHFCYGVVSVPLKGLFVGEERRDCIEGWYNMRNEKGFQGRAYVIVKLHDLSIPDWVYDLKPPYTPAICSHEDFRLYDKIPVIYGGNNKDVVGLIHSSGTTNIILDAVTKKRIYALEKSSFFKKEYVIKDSYEKPFAKCLHKMKSLNKKKIRMCLSNGERMYSIESGRIKGGGFNLFSNSLRKYDNELLVLNATNVPVASFQFGEKENSNMGKSVLIHVLEPMADRPLVLTFALYVLRTS